MAALHPQIVHFVIVLTFVGVAFRLLSLLGKPAFASPAATTLLVLAAVASVPAGQSGIAAHGPVERVPGSRPAVVEHEEWGERTQYVLVGLGLLELVGLAMRRSPHLKRMHVASAVVGVAAAFAVYETGKHGGELVYSYAGGVGLRTGDPRDVERLLLAGYYHQAMADRQTGHPDQASALISAAATRFPQDPEVQTLAAESKLLDQKDPQGAIDALGAVNAGDNRVLRFRVAGLQADAYEALGQKDKAVIVLEAVVAKNPNPRIRQRIDALKGGATAR